jgi:hypothetical protein
VEIGQLIKVLKFLGKCDYVTRKGKIVDETSKIEAFNFKWSEALYIRKVMGEEEIMRKMRMIGKM